MTKPEACIITGCGRPMLCRGLCARCYERSRSRERKKHGSVIRPLCTFGGCTKRLTNSNASGLCKLHSKPVFSGPVERCRHPGCTRELRADNRTRHCFKHYDKTPELQGRFQENAKKYWAVPENKKKNSEQIRRRNGFWPGLFEALLVLQEHKCAICQVCVTDGRGPTGRCADHCHAKWQPRGILCTTCNKRLGVYERMRADGAAYPRYDAYLNHPPIEHIYFMMDEQNYGQHEDYPDE